MELLIDTAFDCCQAGLWRDGRLLAMQARPGEAKHDVVLAPLVADLLREHDVGLSDLAGVAVVTGPGRFTSLRVGIALARALVLPLGVPLQGIATGDILRDMLPETGSGWLVAVKRGEMFVETAGLAGPLALPLEAVSGWLQEHAIQHVAAIGAGVSVEWDAVLPSVIQWPMQRKMIDRLPLDVMGMLAQARFRAGPLPTEPVRPFYGISTGAWQTG